MRTTWWQLTGRVHVGSWRQLKHNLGLSICGGQLTRLSVAISCLMMVAWHKVTRRKFEFYPETVACVCRMRVLIHCCLPAPVDGVWGLLSCMVWFPSAQERQHKMGVWSSLVTRLCESEALFPVWKNNIVFLSFCSRNGARSDCCSTASWPILCFSVTGAERDIRGSAVTSSCRRLTPSCLTQVSFQTLDTNPPSHIWYKSKQEGNEGDRHWEKLLIPDNFWNVYFEFC